MSGLPSPSKSTAQMPDGVALIANGKVTTEASEPAVKLTPEVVVFLKIAIDA